MRSYTRYPACQRQLNSALCSALSMVERIGAGARRDRIASWATSAGVRRSMQSNRPRDTALERSIRSALHRAGLRFRKHRRPLVDLRCEADVVFPTQRLAVFIDGCFWHGCPQHATRPAVHAEWWATKLDRNVERDHLNDVRLRAAGWVVLRIWEHESEADAIQRVSNEVAQLKLASLRQPST
jgi:DNA mismatch endonuclease (patch repair protein)